MPHPRTVLTNARVVLGPQGTASGRWNITLEKGRITAIVPAAKKTARPGDQRIDCKGLTACPGFIDLHVHGALGSDFMDATEHDFRVIAAYHARGGTTAYLPTTASDSIKALTAAIDMAERCRRQGIGSVEILGVHVEGPYFHPKKNGCHDLKWVRQPSAKENQAYLDRAHIIRRITLAPELPGAQDFIRQMARAGIIASGGHSEATADEVRRAADNGMRMITHLYSAMSSIVKNGPYRIAGMLEATLLDDRLATEIIADLRHAPVELLSLALKAKAPDTVCFTTDAMRGAGMPDGLYTFGSRRGTKAVVENGVARNQENTGFASSTSRMIDLVRNGVTALNLSLEESVRRASSVPAAILGLSRRKGTLEVGKDADIVLLADKPQLQVRKTIVRGEVVAMPS